MEIGGRIEMNYLPILSLLAGAAIATQVSMHAQLGVLLKNPLMGTTVAFSVSTIFTLIAVMVSTEHYPQAEVVRSVPIYLWFTGGLLSAFGVAMFYYLTPKMGVGPMMSYALTGQILIAITASHFGWFNLPVKPITVAKFVGVISMISGIFLINWK
jgi:transporter family-2 protein